MTFFELILFDFSDCSIMIPFELHPLESDITNKKRSVLLCLEKLMVQHFMSYQEALCSFAARIVMTERKESGPIRPCHIREAYRSLNLEGKVPKRLMSMLFQA